MAVKAAREHGNLDKRIINISFKILVEKTGNELVKDGKFDLAYEVYERGLLIISGIIGLAEVHQFLLYYKLSAKL